MSALRNARKARGLKLTDAARLVDSDAGNLSRIERGIQAPGRDLARRLANEFDLSVEQVLYPETEEGAAA